MKAVFLTPCLIIITLIAVYSQTSLSGFIDSAKYKSPVLTAQKNNLKLSSLDSSLFRAGLKTQISSQNEAFYYPVFKGIGYDEIITNGQQIGVLVNFDKEVLFKGQMNANLNFFTISRNIAENSLKISEKDLILSITDLYLTSFGDFLQWQYNQDILKLFLTEDSVLQSLTQSNIYKRNDYLLFIAEVNKQKLAVKDARLQYRTDLMSLRNESGIKDTAMISLEEPGLKLNSLPEKENSIFFNRYSLDSLQLVNQEDLIASYYKPHLQLHADAGYLSSLVVTPYRNFGAGIGMSLIIPIYDGRGQQYKVDKVRVEKDNLSSEKNFFSGQYDQQTRQLQSLMNEIKDQNHEIRTQLDFYKQLIETEKKLLSAGQLDILQYFVVIQNYIDLKNQETINKIKNYMLINQLNYLAN